MNFLQCSDEFVKNVYTFVFRTVRRAANIVLFTILRLMFYMVRSSNLKT